MENEEEEGVGKRIVKFASKVVDELSKPSISKLNREVTCCLIRKCYREGSLGRERLVKGLRILLSLYSMAFLSTKGLSCSSCLERLFLSERRTWGD